MRFQQIDAIRHLELNHSIVAVKSLSLSEEYLQDHFPRFPVMPGVIMLESLFQAAGWLVRASEDFANSMVILREAKNVKFADFVEPGDQLVVSCQSLDRGSRSWEFKCDGKVGERVAVRARLVLDRFNLADERPELKAVDQHIVQQLRQQFYLVYPPSRVNEKAMRTISDGR